MIERQKNLFNPTGMKRSLSIMALWSERARLLIPLEGNNKESVAGKLPSHCPCLPESQGKVKRPVRVAVELQRRDPLAVSPLKGERSWGANSFPKEGGFRAHFHDVIDVI